MVYWICQTIIKYLTPPVSVSFYFFDKNAGSISHAYFVLCMFNYRLATGAMRFLCVASAAHFLFYNDLRWDYQIEQKKNSVPSPLKQSTEPKQTREINPVPKILCGTQTLSFYIPLFLPRSFAYSRNSLINTTMNTVTALYLHLPDSLPLNYMIKYMKRIKCLKLVIQYSIK